MRHEDTGNPQLFDHIFEPGTEFLTDLGIDRRKWLIEEEKLRIRSKCSRKSNSLSLPTGKLAWISFFQTLKAYQLDQFHNSAFDVFFVCFLDFQAKSNVVVYGHIAEQRITLEYESDPALTCRNVVDYFSINDDLAAVRLLQTCDHTQDRGLSTSTRTQKTDQFSFLDSKRNMVGCFIISKSFVDIL